ncbi:transglycosylase SLT domain-containing protein [Peribacillus sp. SCS-155]|uniref:transglycosylase SLT domain-containing protein n=1 Tax=Peribacillus sedimenti TaxID=3115297 RepID=UPI0039062099
MRNYKPLYVLSLLFLAGIFFFASGSGAMAATSTLTLVNSASSAAKTLQIQITYPGKATGKNNPVKEFTAAKQKYATAYKAVSKLPAGKTKSEYIARLNSVNTIIVRGERYIDAVTAGKLIDRKRAELEKTLLPNKYDQTAHQAYNALSSALKSGNAKISLVYGPKTRDLFKKYTVPAESLKTKLLYPSIVKQAINDTDILSGNSLTDPKLLPAYKKVILYMDSVINKTYKAQLTAEFQPIHDSLVTKTNGTDTDLAKTVLLEQRFQELDSLVSPGKSDSKVPALYDSLQIEMNILTASERNLFAKKISAVMSELNYSVKDLKTLLTKKAKENGIPPEIVKAIALAENSSLKQFTANGEVFKSSDNGFGIMQVTPLSNTDVRFDWDTVKYDISGNIDTGISILKEKWGWTSKRIPLINNQEAAILENWYFTLMAYNGLSSTNDPNQAKGIPYQVRVYNYIINNGQVKPYLLKKEEVKITKNATSGILSFQDKMQYTTPKKTLSTQLYKMGETFELKIQLRFRSTPTTSSKESYSPKGTKITIIDGPYEDDKVANFFNWYKVKTVGSNTIRYIASSNLKIGEDVIKK